MTETLWIRKQFLTSQIQEAIRNENEENENQRDPSGQGPELLPLRAAIQT